MEHSNALEAASVQDSASFISVFDDHYDNVWAFVARLSGVDSADDLAADVFVAAYAARSTFDESRGTVRSWLYGIARNKVRMRYRSEGRRRAAFLKAATMAEPPQDPTGLVDDTMALHDRVNRVRGALAELHTSDRELLILFAWEELSYAEIAASLDIPIGTVRSRLNRARSKLMELTGSAGKEPNDSEEVL
ncbi:MAG: RNA polymerase sigma factor [Acidimicrobiales bacterium]